MVIPLHQIEFSFFRSSGPGGQKKNTTDSAVRARHIPTGIVVVATASRSQHQNKQLAVEELERRLAAMRHRPKPRKATRPSRASQRKRIESKKRRGARKQLRRTPGNED
jgi:protein subunit release factor B